jgi:hypothetical protein
MSLIEIILSGTMSLIEIIGRITRSGRGRRVSRPLGRLLGARPRVTPG